MLDEVRLGPPLGEDIPIVVSEVFGCTNPHSKFMAKTR